MLLSIRSHTGSNLCAYISMESCGRRAKVGHFMLRREMGNSMGGGKKAKVMKVSGETIKLRTPILAREVVKDYPGHVLLESEAVKQIGLRARPLEPHQGLKPKKIYFLVELPKLPKDDKMPRRARSGIQMSAKDRLECLMLSRRSISDVSMVRSTNTLPGEAGPRSGPLQVKMRLPKAQVAKLLDESRDEAEVASKIIDLCIGKAVTRPNGHVALDGGEDMLQHRISQWKPGLGSIGESSKAP